MSSIYNIANTARKIFQHGAGIGIPIGNLREKDAYIYEGNPDKPPEGQSSGPITFMKLYDAVGETTKSGGRVRRAAILCSMPCWHPDIVDFISCKEKDGRLANMNISVLITDKFMKAFDDGISFDLLSPSNGQKMGEVDPQEVWMRLADMAHKSGDPGVIFIDAVNRYNPLIKDMLIECTNPCGEQPLLPFNCCNLSALNLGMFIRNGDFDWEKLYDVSRKVMKLMDNAIDVMDYPDPRFKETALKYRPVGVGIMGLADVLYALNLRYDGPDGRKFASDIMRTITTACVDMSAELAAKHGPFHNYDKYKEDMERVIREHVGNNPETMEAVIMHGVRNIQFTTAQPTGTTALSADASYGIEPMMGLVFQKNLISGEKMIVANPVFEQRFKKEKWYSDVLIDKIFRNGGSLKGIHGIPKEVRDVFVVAHDIGYKSRIDMQAELQKYCSTAISSTVNLPKETTKDEIADLYRYAYDKGLKGVTIYRDGSKRNQPVTFDNTPKEFKRPNRMNSDTFTVETGNGKMYVTISDDDGHPLEVFLFLGKSGQILNTFSEALGRVLSLALQNGVPVGALTKTLRGINCDTIAWHRFEDNDERPTQILSIPDGIAKLLDRYYLGQKERHTNGTISGEICPKCGLNMKATEGCFACICGHSKCN
jgi:ribonucleoside-diphosphate reductase alpha chain